MRILLIAPGGQIGSALVDTLPSLGQVLAVDRSRLDLTSFVTIRSMVQEWRPNVVVNAAAYTAVDQAEREEGIARAINCDGPAVLAEEAARANALLVHFSSDYIFDGEKSLPYVETDVPNPLNAYGRTKLAGEQAIVASGCRHLIFRTSWVYAASGKNFLLTMLRLAQQGRSLRIVDDQFGAPTSNLIVAAAVPDAIRRTMADESLSGIYHLTAGGKTTWYHFARAIFEASGTGVSVEPVTSSEYEAPARRPMNSVLDNSKLARRLDLRLPPWEEALKPVLSALNSRGQPRL
jgi:dTDP-4-dehydrorhamnose reductase